MDLINKQTSSELGYYILFNLHLGRQIMHIRRLIHEVMRRRRIIRQRRDEYTSIKSVYSRERVLRGTAVRLITNFWLSGFMSDSL